MFFQFLFYEDLLINYIKNLLINYFFIILSFLSIFLLFYDYNLFLFLCTFFFLDKSLKNEQNIKQKIK